MSEAWHILRCPSCGECPGPQPGTCAGCGRDVRSATGGFDLLTDAERSRADAFASLYSALRRREGWAGADGVEGLGHGEDRLWGPRRRAAEAAAGHVGGGLVLDVGAGGGWLADLLPEAEVVAVDLLDPPAGRAELRVRGDMLRLPVADEAVDACVYCASLHHAPVAAAVAVAARVLRPGGRLVMLESPVYPDSKAAAAARERSRDHYRDVGAPGLIDTYFPIAHDALRAALAGARLTVEVFDDPGGRGLGRLLARPRRFPFLLARRAGGEDRGRQHDQ